MHLLWFENKYQMKVHLFGAASSPGVAEFCLHQTAETHRQDFGNITSDFLLRDFYVDDGLKSVPTAEQALQFNQGRSNNVRKRQFTPTQVRQ